MKKLIRNIAMAICMILPLLPLAGDDALPELFKKRKYREVVETVDRTLPGLAATERSKALLYKAYALEKLRKPGEAMSIVTAIADDRDAASRHRTESLIAAARLAAAGGENPNPYYWRVLAMPKAYAAHRETAGRALKAALKTEQVARPDRTYFENDRFVGLATAAAAILFDRRTGQPAGLWSVENVNLLNNAAAGLPFWELRFREPAGSLAAFHTLQKQQVKHVFNRTAAEPELSLIYESPRALVTVTVRIPAGGARPEMAIKVDNRSGLPLWDLDFPVLAVRPPVSPAECEVIYPWRKGRKRPIERQQEAQEIDYPGSSARFQFIALCGSGKGMYFQAVDAAGYEKRFRVFYSPETELFIIGSTQYPANRGMADNPAAPPYVYQVGGYTGDWYDAARIYRAWWLRQEWAGRGPLVTNKVVPEWLKKSPVWLRFYLRESTGNSIASNRRIALAWAEFLGNQPTPATLYHYSAFKEPPDRPAYPVAEYYGFNAPPFPGLPELLRELSGAGIRSNVYLQSEIYNQDHPLNADLVDTLRVGLDGKPRLYVNERFVACRQSAHWRERFLGMVDHLLNMGFWGIYLDTYGKSKIDNDCFDVRHGHACGGGNIDVTGQRGQGRQVLALVKKHNPDFYIGGEACGEAYVDILDYKLNATSVYKDMLDVERVLYGDYFLRHARLVRSEDDENDRKLMLVDFLGGVIPGRFFSGPPRSEKGRQLLKDIIAWTACGGEYMRTGEALRRLPFGAPAPEVTLTDTTANRKLSLPSLQNGVFRSWKDGSIGLCVINIGSAPVENTLLLTEKGEWNLPASATITQVAPDGTGTILGTLGEIKELRISLPPDGALLYVIAAKEGGAK